MHISLKHNVIILILLLTPIFDSVHSEEPKADTLSKSGCFFVINFDSGAYGSDKLTLDGFTVQSSGNTTDSDKVTEADKMGGLYQVDVNDFITLWDGESRCFGKETPFASLPANGRQSNVRMSLLKTNLKDKAIIFDVKLLKGTPPSKLKSGLMFISKSGEYSFQ